MATLGMSEMIVIFVLALVLFGPKKLPEIGRTVGKAITEFRRASTELKSTFTKEMQSLEQETQSIKEAAKDAAGEYQYDNYNYDYSCDSGYQDSTETAYGEQIDSSAASETTESASAPQGAESTAEGQEGTIAFGSDVQVASETYEGEQPQASEPDTPSEPKPASAEQNA